MAHQVDFHTSSPIARSANVPEPAAKPVAPHEVVKTPVQRRDTVTLSLSAHIHQLKGQGQNANQIAANLGVDPKTVDGYFSAPAAKPIAPPAPQPEAQPDAKPAPSASAAAPTPAAASANQTSATK